MIRAALCIGINTYPGAPLRGCVNDALDWAEYFAAAGCRAVSDLVDRDATRANIVGALMRMLSLLESGDTGVVQFSGHGTRVLDLDGDEPDGWDEAIVPVECTRQSLILDDELRTLFAQRHPESRLVWISDCCHSGSVFRFAALDADEPMRVRFLPPEHFSDAREVRVLSALKRAPAKGGGSNAALPGVAHFSACDDREYAYDASFDGRPNGAFTYHALRALHDAQTYAGLFVGIRGELPSRAYPQTPRLNAPAAVRRRKVWE